MVKTRKNSDGVNAIEATGPAVPHLKLNGVADGTLTQAGSRISL